MSIKYGKSKAQYVKGKPVENLTVIVNKNSVEVDYDKIGSVKMKSNSMKNLEKYLGEQYGETFKCNTVCIDGQQYVLIKSPKYLHESLLHEKLKTETLTMICSEFEYKYLVPFSDLSKNWWDYTSNELVFPLRFDLLETFEKSNEYLYEIVQERLDKAGLENYHASSWDNSTVTITRKIDICYDVDCPLNIKKIRDCLNLKNREVISIGNIAIINVARMRELR